MYATALPLFKKFHPEVTDEATLKDVKHVNSVYYSPSQPRKHDNIVEQRKASGRGDLRFQPVRTAFSVIHGVAGERDIACRVFPARRAIASAESPDRLSPQGETFYAISTRRRRTGAPTHAHESPVVSGHMTGARPQPRCTRRARHYHQRAQHSNKFKRDHWCARSSPVGSFAREWAGSRHFIC